MIDYLLSMLIILLSLLGWVMVQHWSRVFAARHPELGPARDEGENCGASCLCRINGRCTRQDTAAADGRNV